MMVPSNTRMHPWEHGQVSWELGVSDSDLEGFVCQLWLSCHTFKWFLKLLLTRALSMSTHVSLALPRKSESQAGLGPVTHLPESLKTLVTVSLSFRGQWTEVASWTAVHNQSHCTECRLLHYTFFTQTTNCCPHCWPLAPVSCWPNLHSCGFPALSWNRLQRLNGSLSEVTIVKWDQPAGSY